MTYSPQLKLGDSAINNTCVKVIRQPSRTGIQDKKETLNYEHEYKATSEENIDIIVASFAEKYRQLPTAKAVSLRNYCLNLLRYGRLTDESAELKIGGFISRQAILPILNKQSE